MEDGMSKMKLFFLFILFSTFLLAHNAEMLINVQNGAQKTVRLYKVNNWWQSEYRSATSSPYSGYSSHCDVLPSYDDYYLGRAIWKPVDYSTWYFLRIDNRYVKFYINYYSTGGGDGDFYITYHGWNFTLDVNNRGITWVEGTQNWPPPQPVQINVSGPNMLNFKEKGTWTGNVSGGSGSFTYAWYKSFNGGATWNGPFGDNTNTFTTTMLFSDFSIRCNVTDSQTNETDSDTHNVELIDEGNNLPPSAPQNLSVRESSNKHPLLVWDVNTEPDEPDIDGYKIYRKGGSVDWEVIATTTSGSRRIAKISYEDTELSTSHRRGDDYFYKVTAVASNGIESGFSNIVEIEARLGKKLNEYSSEDFPKEYSLAANYPNPFNPTTQISYQLPKDGFVSLSVFNALGQEVAELVNQHQAMGKYSVQFNANNLPSGVYIYKLQAGDFSSVKKMLLTK